MYAVSLRIPYHLFGQVNYINISAHTVACPYQLVGKTVQVFNTRYGHVRAEVVQIARTTRPSSDFEWGLVS